MDKLNIVIIQNINYNDDDDDKSGSKKSGSKKSGYKKDYSKKTSKKVSKKTDDDEGLDCSDVDGRYVVVSCNIEACPVVIHDCDGRDASAHRSWVGDGVCDDGTQEVGSVINFDCEEWNEDGGDCDEECTDCNGNDCRGQRDRQGDNKCDNDEDGLDFYCAEWRYDLLDCSEEEPCTDCNGDDCSEHTHWIGDGQCDDEFDCEAFNFDEGDCLRDCDGMCGVPALIVVVMLCVNPLCVWLDRSINSWMRELHR